ncbi:MAG: PEP-CTERM sorting domain-containing protein [Gemmatimonadaceae bacterium]|nr:PEP-CTERM sorting domain-containing protein [Gemmatimonadaceae bacterium]
MIHAQVVTTGAWNTMVTPNNDLTPFWDGASSDGTNCNVGRFLLYTAGAGFGSCNNQKPTDPFVNANAGRLGTTASAPNGSFLGAATANAPVGFAFKAGSYQLEFLANIAAYGPPGQELWAFGAGSSGPVQIQKLYAVGSYPSALTSILGVTFATDWFLGARSAATGNPWLYSNDTNDPHYALFSERGATQDNDGYRYWAAFGDVPTGDHDFNDLVIQVQAVPEPSTWALMIFGLGALGLAARRRQRTM